MSKVVHFEIPADDLDRAKSFYGSVFGWELQTVPMNEGVHLRKDHRRDEQTQNPPNPGLLTGACSSETSA